ncbi:MAG: tRNA (adenosine(37)-N6)-dimethylallyltransferase MiaA [Firmicutes bacterium]|nr:tRNA (adenosine(37)-N6)-dimethylallyltransferase MiaA [Bacillota bacterium]
MMILCVVGPTGVGKTKLSVALAKKYNAIIINADAMQVYKGLDIGTAKIKESEKESVPHFLFDIKDVKENYTVYDYQKDARKILEENKDKNIVFVGGTGLYLKAALYNYVFNEEENNNNYDMLTNEELYKLCKEKDENMDIHLNNRKRLIRFLNKEKVEKEDCFQIYDATFIGLTTNRELLYERINNRVEEMFDEGLLEEVKYFYDNNIYSKAINTGIGYKELYKYFNKEINLDEAKELIKKNSRHYAKRQYTWFNNQMDVIWFNVDFKNFDNTINEVINYIDNNKI